MNPQDSLDRLQTLVLVCQQLPVEESDRLMLLAIESPEAYADAIAGMSSAGRLRLPAYLVDLLHRDRGALPVAV